MIERGNPLSTVTWGTSAAKKFRDKNSESEQIRTLLDRQTEKILADCQAEADERRRQDPQLLHEQLLKQNWDLREAHEKSLNEMEELKRFQGSTFDTIARRKLVEDRDTVLELTGKIQELQNEIICMNDSREIQDAESVRSGHSHVISHPAVFPPFREAPYPQKLNPWGSHISEPIHSSPAGKSEKQTPVQDQRCQSGPSAKSSILPSEGDTPKNHGAVQQRLQISDLHFDKFRTPATFACWKIRFKTEVCTCSQFPTEAMLWIKEVEMVDAVDDFKFSSSIQNISMPNFVLDARIASARTESSIVLTSKKRISLEEMKAQKEDRFLCGRQIVYLIYEYFRVTGANDSVENYADIYNCSSK